MGYTQMVLASFGLRQGATMADWTSAANELNKIGEATQKAGIQMAFHNHNMEFESLGGELIYDRLMTTFDSKLVKSQFQVAVASLGVDPVKVVRKYSGRILSMHLADWVPAEKKLAAVGAGSVVWKELFAAAKAGGVKNYFVEVDRPAMKASYDYLHTMKQIRALTARPCAVGFDTYARKKSELRSGPRDWAGAARRRRRYSVRIART